MDDRSMSAPHPTLLDLLPSPAASRQDAGALGRAILRMATLAASAHRWEQVQRGGADVRVSEVQEAGR